MSLEDTPKTTKLFAPLWAKNTPPTDEELDEVQKQFRALERENIKLKEELERNTQEIDSYGEPGSNFRICAYCKAESGAGMLDKGIPHEPGCILSNGLTTN